MRTITRLIAVLALTTAAGGVLASPAHAASDPAVTGCPFTGLYATYSDGQLSDLQYSYPRDTALTVTGGDGNAALVTVNHTGQHGWMDASCVLFLA
ncbi:MAG: hypothetical protein KJO75_04250 [Dactylosporangium sp.]|nr:hypothetical protein [Dactylosporangium sp.]